LALYRETTQLVQNKREPIGGGTRGEGHLKEVGGSLSDLYVPRQRGGIDKRKGELRDARAIAPSEQKRGESRIRVTKLRKKPRPRSDRKGGSREKEKGEAIRGKKGDLITKVSRGGKKKETVTCAGRGVT